MMKEYVRNETALAAGAVREHDLTESGAAVIGSSPLAERLRMTTEYLGAAYSFFDSAEELKGNCSSLLCFAEEGFEPEALSQTIRRSTAEKATVIIPLENIPDHAVIQRYAESELLAVKPALHRALKQLQKASPIPLRVVLLDRLFGAGYDPIGLCRTAAAAEKTGAVTVLQADAVTHRSVLTVPDAIAAILTVAKYGKNGNVYNATSFAFSEYTLKSAIYSLLAPHSVQLHTEDGASCAPVYAVLFGGKLNALGFAPCSSFEDTLRYALIGAVNAPIQQDFLAASYDGKLSLLRRLQLEALSEIDRICRKHGIPYFLSGGSMLGAVRHEGYIPWDDDIDVAFLREPYERFKAVVRDELDDKFLYQNYENRNGYHYFFDRVTAKDTYFATKYSDVYDMPKGVSVDIFVFDRAPKNAERFWKGLMNRRLVMNVRWRNVARRNKAYLLSKLLLPILRLRSMDSYSAAYEKAVKRYRRRNTGYVLPPATDHCYKGSMPESWFDEVIPARFEGIDSFIPKGYDAYLKIWYGDDYMTVLPLFEQRSYHDYYRLDLGRCASDSDTAFDYRGELL